MKNDIKQYRSHIFFMGLFVFLLHSAKINSVVIGIDTEDLIHSEQNLYGGWLGTGRQGLVFLKYFLGNSHFNPYFSGMMTLVMFALAVSAFFLLWDYVKGGRDGKFGLTAWILGGLMWISHPVLAEQFYFSLQSMEICICFLLTAGALALSRLWVEKRMKGRFLLFPAAVALLLVTFSGYQIFVALYIFGVVTMLLLRTVREFTSEEEFSVKCFWKSIGGYLLLFLAAFVINFTITKLFFSNSDYLQDQILWGRIDFTDNIRNILHHMRQVLTGAGSIFYHWGYGLLCVTSFLLLLRLIWHHRRRGKLRILLLLFVYCAVMLMPFLMTLIMGGAPVIRSQLILPVMTGFLAYLNIALLQQAELPQGRAELCAAAVVVLISAAGGLAQAKTTEALYYTDRCRYEQDVALAETLIKRLKLVNRWNLPVVFVGSIEFEPNNACVEGEIIGRSFFDYDTEVEPLDYWSTRRILGFLHTLGADYEQVPADRMEEALKYSTYMAMWPEENCVEIWDDIVVVKLSDY